MIRGSWTIAVLMALTGAPLGATTFTVTNTSNSGGGSLRAAITAANGAAGPHTINFTAAGTISPLSALPALTQPTTVQPPTIGAVTLSGASAGAGVDGLTLAANGCIVKSLIITGFSGNGIRVSSNGNTIGATGAQRNVISANGSNGVLVTGSSNTIAGNLIGTDGNGSLDNGNASNGIHIQNVASNVVESNVIGGNNGSGVAITGAAAISNTIRNNFIGLRADATGTVGNSFYGVLVDGAGVNTIGTGNVISGNGFMGVLVNGGAGGTDVIGNTIGCNIAGDTALPNGSHGVEVADSPNVHVGGDATVGRANFISGNGGNGVFVHGAAASGATVVGNTIGTRASGMSALPNALRGVAVIGSSNVTIGDATVAGGDNTISGNGGDGVYIQGGSGNRVLTNTIGNGSDTAVPNNGSGIYLDSTVNPILDTSLIGGNTSHGIRIAGGSGALVIGNVIGVTLNGNSPLPNGGNGISLEGTSGATIGQVGGGKGNTMSSNGGAGIAITNSSNTTIDAAVVGLNVSANAPLPNLGHGVLVQGTSNNNAIGTPATASYVATNAGIGVAILAGTGNRIRGTRIFANGAQGIDLDRNGAAPFDGVTYNDPGDVDSGANGLLNAPVLLSSTVTTVNGRLRGLANTQHTVDLFNSALCDKEGFGEGTVLLTSTTVTTNASGSATFSLGPWAAVASNSSYTAIATDPAGNTSEFSQCATAGRRPAETLALFSPSTHTAGLTGSLYGVSGDPMPLAALTVYATGINLGGQQGNWVMGDWDGDGIQTPGVYASGGAFFYTNSAVATSSWTGIWFGYQNRPAVAGRFDGAVNHDCIGIIDSAPWGAQDTAFVMYWTCDLAGGSPPKNSLWLGSPLATSGFGEIGAYQFLAGDFDGDGVDTIAVRRGPYIVWGGAPNQAQNFGMPLAPYGDAVTGDWDGDGISTFGIYYQTEQFFYLNHLDWANMNYTQQVLPSNHGMTEPLRPVSWRPGGS